MNPFELLICWRNLAPKRDPFDYISISIGDFPNLISSEKLADTHFCIDRR